MKGIKDLKTEVSDLKDSLELTENVIEKKLEKLETELDNLQGKFQEIWDYHINADYIQLKLVESEDRSRQNNLRIDGIEEEKWEIAESEPTRVFRENGKIPTNSHSVSSFDYYTYFNY